MAFSKVLAPSASTQIRSTRIGKAANNKAAVQAAPRSLHAAVYRRALDVRANAAAVAEPASLVKDPEAAEVAYLATRVAQIRQHFPSALSCDDMLHRLEQALFAFGFTGDNTIACTNLCRDEITITVKNKIDAVFGSSFNINGLGGVLTCGVTGVKAGLSHSPTCATSGKERYVFFSMPHISIDASGNIGAISRPGRAGASCACGALIGSLAQIKAAGLADSCKKPGVHDYSDPELSILKQRIARRMRFEGYTEDKVQEMDLVEITKIAERTISDDLEFLIKNAVDPSKADFAVVTAVQIHNWGTEFDNDEPNLEFVAPTGVYVVVNGEKTYIDLEAIPSLTPRQIALLAKTSAKPAPSNGVVNNAGSTVARAIDAPFLYSSTQERQAKEGRAKTYAKLIVEENLPAGTMSKPMWVDRIESAEPTSRASSVSLDESSLNQPDVDAITKEFIDKLRTVASQQVLDQMKQK